MAVQPEKEPLSPEAEVKPATVQYLAPSQQIAEAVYIHNVAKIEHEQYKGRLSIILGIILIILQTLAIIVNIVGAVVQGDRSGGGYFVRGNFVFYLFPSIWCGIFVYISAGFAIAAGKRKLRGLIIAHLVLACIACIFAFVCGAKSIGAVIYEASRDIRDGSDKASVALSAIWLLLSWVIFVLVIWCAVLCCKVLCCGKAKEVKEVEIVTPINCPPGVVIAESQPAGEK